MESIVSMEKLNTLNVFRSINIRSAFVSTATDKTHPLFQTHLRLDATDSGRGSTEGGGGGGGEKGVIVTFQVKEKKRVKSSLGATVGSQSGDMVGS